MPLPMTDAKARTLIQLLKLFDRVNPGHYDVEKLIIQVAMKYHLNPDEIEP